MAESYSINYDRLLMDNVSCRIGYSFLDVQNAQISTMPLLVNYLYGEKNSKIELGLGITIINISVTPYVANLPQVLSVSTTLVTEAFGYRYQQQDGGIMFRADITPFYYPETRSCYLQVSFIRRNKFGIYILKAFENRKIRLANFEAHL
jgi:hypothetical protein